MFLFAPEPGFDEREDVSWTRTIAVVRGLVGYALSVGAYRGVASEVEVFGFAAEKWATMLVPAGIIAVAVSVLALWLSSGAERRTIRRGLKYPIVTAIKAGVFLALPTYFFIQATGFPDSAQCQAECSVIALPFILWGVPFLATAAFILTRDVFSVAFVNPILVPFAATSLAVAATVNDLIQFDTKGIGVTPWLILTLSGFASVSALSVLEFHLLRRAGKSLSVSWPPRPRLRT